MEIGTPAENFTLSDDMGQELSLSELRGQWVVVYFYPRDNTSGCTTEALEFTALQPEFAALGAVIVGISPDSCETHRKFKIKHDLGIRLLSDPDHLVMSGYGAWGEKKMYGRISQGVIRSTVLIDPDGNIACHWPRVRARGHAEKVLAALRERREIEGE